MPNQLNRKKLVHDPKQRNYHWTLYNQNWNHLHNKVEASNSPTLEIRGFFFGNIPPYFFLILSSCEDDFFSKILNLYTNKHIISQELLFTSCSSDGIEFSSVLSESFSSSILGSSVCTCSFTSSSMFVFDITYFMHCQENHLFPQKQNPNNQNKTIIIMQKDDHLKYWSFHTKAARIYDIWLKNKNCMAKETKVMQVRIRWTLLYWLPEMISNKIKVQSVQCLLQKFGFCLSQSLLIL